MLAALALCASDASAQPHIGYLYPAGGRAGDIFSVTVGGQNLQNITGVYVSGDGVRLAGIRYMGRLQAAEPAADAGAPEKARRDPPEAFRRSATAAAQTPANRNPRPVGELPNDPLLDSLDDLSEGGPSVGGQGVPRSQPEG